MRRLLLASIAAVGMWGAIADADAQTVLTPTYSGPGTPPAPKPEPGQVVVRLNGRVRFYAYASGDHDGNNNAGTTNAGNKVDNYGFAEYGRLYPGFDGIAANGLKYGASLEIRQDAGGNAGGGAFGSISGRSSVRGSLYFRRVWGYLGTDQLGTIRLGSIDQPTSTYLTGNFENFNDGGWNGDFPGFVQSNLAPLWPFSDVGSYYTTNKVVYLSPQIFGFDLGASYEPSTANLSGSVNCSISAPGCDNLTSTPNLAETARRRNTFDVLLRYRGSFGPVGIAATGAYITGSHVQFNDINRTGTTNNPLAAGGARYNYEGLNIGDFGAAVTIAGLSFGGHYTFGRFNGNVANPVPSGIQDTNAWLAGASYTFGPAIVGASYFVADSAGDLTNAFYGRGRKDQGVAVGGTYSVAPGIAVFVSGLWGQRKQNGYDFVTGTGVTPATGIAGSQNHNKVNVTTFGVGTAFSW